MKNERELLQQIINNQSLISRVDEIISWHQQEIAKLKENSNFSSNFSLGSTVGSIETHNASIEKLKNFKKFL